MGMRVGRGGRYRSRIERGTLQHVFLLVDVAPARVCNTERSVTQTSEVTELLVVGDGGMRVGRGGWGR